MAAAPAERAGAAEPVDDAAAEAARVLAELDRDLAAGELDRPTYERLRERYERRLRGEAPPPRKKAKPAVAVAAVAFVVLVAVAAGVLVARSSGRRDPGEPATGAEVATAPTAPPATIPDGLVECRNREGGERIACLTGYADAHPDDPAGYVELGLFSVEAGLANERAELVEAGETFLRRALDVDPGYLPARVYLAVLYDRQGRAEEAAAECAALEGEAIPADLLALHRLACAEGGGGDAEGRSDAGGSDGG